MGERGLAFVSVYITTLVGISVSVMMVWVRRIFIDRTEERFWDFIEWPIKDPNDARWSFNRLKFWRMEGWIWKCPIILFLILLGSVPTYWYFFAWALLLNPDSFDVVGKKQVQVRVLSVEDTGTYKHPKIRIKLEELSTKKMYTVSRSLHSQPKVSAGQQVKLTRELWRQQGPWTKVPVVLVRMARAVTMSTLLT